MLRRQLPNLALLALELGLAPSTRPSRPMSTWRRSLVDVATAGVVRTELAAHLGHSSPFVVLARSLLCAVLVIKLSLFERASWDRPWVPIAIQGANIAWCWLETLLPIVRDLWSLANAPHDAAEEVHEEDELRAAAEAVRRRQRQQRATAAKERRARKLLAGTAAADDRTNAASAAERPRVPSLVELATRALAHGLPGEWAEFEPDEHGRPSVLPLPPELLRPLAEHMRVHGLIADHTLPLLLDEDARALALSAGARCGLTGALLGAEADATGGPESEALGSVDGHDTDPADAGCAAALVLAARRAYVPRARQPGPPACALTDFGVELLASRCAGLRALGLTDCAALTDRGVSLLCRGCPRLEALELRRCPALSSASLLELAAALPACLRALHVGGCGQVDDAGVGAVGRACSKLRSLDVSGCQVRDETLYVLQEHAAELADLNIVACIYLSADAIGACARGCVRLRRLAMSRSFNCSSVFVDTLQTELPKLELTVEPASLPPSLRWHPLPFTEFY